MIGEKDYYNHFVSFHQIDRETYDVDYQSAKPTIILAKPAALDSVCFWAISMISRDSKIKVDWMNVSQSQALVWVHI